MQGWGIQIHEKSKIKRAAGKEYFHDMLAFKGRDTSLSQTTLKMKIIDKYNLFSTTLTLVAFYTKKQY